MRQSVQLAAAGHVAACVMVLRPIFERIQEHVIAAERLHGDDTTVLVLASRSRSEPG